MAAPAQSPLRRWKRFFGAFESVDAAMEAADPVLLPRRAFRSARGDIIERLCNVADDDHAEQLCLVLDDMMAESLETLRLIPATPTVLATADVTKSVCALRKHESERVRVLASGIVTGWGLDKLSQPKEEVGDQRVHAHARTMKPVKILQEIPAKKSSDPANAKMDTISQPKKTDARATRPAKIPEKKAVDVVVRSDHGAVLCYEEKIEIAKRKFKEGYQEANDAKRQRKVQEVESPEMLRQRQKRMHRFLREGSRARCGSSMVKKTFSVIHRA